jgi:hypothetical protein
MALTQPDGQLLATATQGVPSGVDGVLTSPTLSAYAGATASLKAPAPALGIAATGGILARGALTQPAFDLTAAGTTSEMARAAMTAPDFALLAYGGASGSAALPTGTLLASATVTSLARVALTQPASKLTATGTMQPVARAALLMPMLQAVPVARGLFALQPPQLVATATQIVPVTYEAYSINLNRALDRNPKNQYDAAVDEVTRYTNYPFDRIVRYQGDYYGVAEDGLYLLSGPTDDGAAITYSFKTCITDFEAPQQKTVEAVYLAGKCTDATVLQITGLAGDTVRSFAAARPLAQNMHRQMFGRGTKQRYHAVGLTGSKELVLDAIEFVVGILKRRIGT